MTEQNFYNVPEAARVLRYSERHIRKLLADGELEGERDESGRWRVYQHSVHRMLPDRPPRVERPSDSLEIYEGTRELVERVESLHERLEALQHDLGRAQARAELTEKAESTVREERDRLLRELEEERAERHRLQLELETAYERERHAQRPWWRRLFGTS